MMKLYDMDQQIRIDEFGVDHSNFSLRDEIEYNFRRAKEKEMQQNKYQQLAKSYADVVPIDSNVNLSNSNGYNIRDDKNYTWDMPKQISSVSAQPTHSSYWSGVPTAALTGFADGTIGGTERFANGLSGGRYGSFMDKYANNSYSNRQNRLQSHAYQSGVGSLYDTANKVLDTDAEIAKYYYVTKFGNKFIK